MHPTVLGGVVIRNANKEVGAICGGSQDRAHFGLNEA